MIGFCANEAVEHPTVLHDKHSRNTLHLKRLRDAGVFINIDLGEHHLTVCGITMLFQNRAERLTWLTPWRP